MRDQGNWSISLGRWYGLHVRLHMFFLVFAALTVFIGRAQWELALTSLGILLVSVLLHELGHFRAAVRLGGGTDRIVLGPLGGLYPISIPREPQAELIVHLAGPLVNLCVFLAAAVLLIVIDPPKNLFGLLNPLQPEYAEIPTPASRVLGLTLWINWLLLLINLLPAFPFDGGQALRAALTVMWGESARPQAARIVARCAQFASLGLLVAAVILTVPNRTNAPELLVPPWLLLVLLAILLFFSAKQEEGRQEERETEDEVFGYDFSQGYTSLERTSKPHAPRPGLLSRWLNQRREARMERQRQREADEERRVDEILVRLHEQGIESLTNEDRALLDRVSARYRSRSGNRT